MLRYKEVVVERLLCTCDRCGKDLHKNEDDVMDWQERFVVSFRGGYGSVFGDGNYVEGDFCQECIAEVLGKWLRVTDDDPFNSKVKPENEAEKIMQPYQFKKHLEEEKRRRELEGLLKKASDRQRQEELVAAKLGISIEQVSGIALTCLLEKLEKEEAGLPQSV